MQNFDKYAILFCGHVILWKVYTFYYLLFSCCLILKKKKKNMQFYFEDTLYLWKIYIYYLYVVFSSMLCLVISHHISIITYFQLQLHFNTYNSLISSIISSSFTCFYKNELSKSLVTLWWVETDIKR